MTDGRDPLVRPTSGPATSRVAGGKGASLAAMTAAGLPVPPGFVVRAGVLEESVDAERLRELARAEDHAAAQAARPRGRAAAGRSRRRVRAARRRRRRPLVGLRRGLRGRELRRPAGDVPARRGAPTTSAPASSTAGPPSSASGRSSTARARARSTTSAWRSSCSAWSSRTSPGVLFTVDPVQRRRDRMIVEAVFGLGEQVVSGEVTPDHYVLDRQGEVKREHLVIGRGARSGRARAARRARPPARGALRRAAGRRVGDRRRRDLPAPVEAGDDAVTLEERARDVDRAVLERAAPACGRATGCSSSSPTPAKRCGVAALTHDMERHFPGGPQLDMATQRPDDEDVQPGALRALGSDRRRLAPRGGGGRGARGRGRARSILAHEFGGWHEADVLQAADSISLLETNQDVAQKWVREGRCDEEWAREKHRWMLRPDPDRTGPRARAAALRGGARRCLSPLLSGSRPRRSPRRSRLKAEHGDEATVVAGGTFLAILLNQRLLAPQRFLSLRARPRARGIEANGELRLGAMETHRAVELSTAVREGWPGLAARVRARGEPARPQPGNRGRSACGRGLRLRPAGDANRARGARARQEPGRRARDPARGADHGPLRDVAARRRADRRAFASRARSGRRTGSSAAARTRTAPASASRPPSAAARSAWSSARSQPVRSGSPRSARSPTARSSTRPSRARSQSATPQAIDPIADVRGSADYRRRVIRVEVRRALEELRTA